MKSFYSNGKLLLTGEYAVLDGALAWAIPTKLGQSLIVTASESSRLIWKSFDEKGGVWFEGVYNLRTLAEISTSDRDMSRTLLNILRESKKLNPAFLIGSLGYEIKAKLDFPRNWGLGSSSTLINNIAQWAEVDAYKLLKKAFGGSGYDIACAQSNSPILYQIKNGLPDIKKNPFNKTFRKNLYFVHLNEKQNSREEITRYAELHLDRKKFANTISQITESICNCENLQEFEGFLIEHETVLSSVLKIPPVKESLFQEFDGAVKSLGAWGGDFILATGNANTPNYFKKKGFTTVIPFDDMIF